MKLAALRCRDFRLYWIALVISAAGTWMQIIAQSLLVLRLSHGNAAALGLVALAQAAAFFLFALFGGSIVDRVDRGRLLLITQSILMIIALITGLLVAWQLVHVWMVVVAAFLSGVVLSFDQPARASFLPSLVPEADLASAVSLQSVVFTIAAALAPLLAGLSITRFGLAGNYFFNAASCLAAILALLFVRHSSLSSDIAPPPRRLLDSIQDGLQVVKNDRVLTWAVSGWALLLLAAPSMQILLPVLADRILHVGAATLGVLFAAFGTGAIGGALLVPWLAAIDRVDRVYFGALVIWVVAMFALAATHRTGAYICALLLLGGAQGAVGTLTVTLLQSRVAKKMRGRMMSLQTLLNMGVRPLGDFPLSLLIAAVGALATVAISAALMGGYCLYLASAGNRSWHPAAVSTDPK